MRIRASTGFGATLSLLAATTIAFPSFEGLQFEQYIGPEWIEHGYPVDDLVTFRLYALFTEPTEGVASVFGFGPHPLYCYSYVPCFWNSPEHDSLTAPEDLTGPPLNYWENQWDTYVTIGLDDAEGGDTVLVPSVEEFAAATGNLSGPFTLTSQGWFISPLDPQGLGTQVLIAQITLPRHGSWEQTWLIVNIQDYETNQYQDVSTIVPPPPPPPPPDYGDVNSDGEVDVLDLLEVLAHWGEPALWPLDTNCDSTIDLLDVLSVLENWG
jgi:hypothetical protein